MKTIYNYKISIPGTTGYKKYPIQISFEFPDKKYKALEYIFKWENHDICEDLIKLSHLHNGSSEITWGIDPLNFSSNNLITNVSCHVYGKDFNINTKELIQIFKQLLVYRILMENQDYVYKIIDNSLNIFFRGDNHKTAPLKRMGKILYSDFIFSIYVQIAMTQEDYEMGKDKFMNKINYSV